MWCDVFFSLYKTFFFSEKIINVAILRNPFKKQNKKQKTKILQKKLLDTEIKKGIDCRDNIAIDSARPNFVGYFQQHTDFRIEDGWKIAEKAREIKNKDEIEALKLACKVGDIATQRMIDFTRNNINNKQGITENQIFSILAQTNIEFGG